MYEMTSRHVIVCSQSGKNHIFNFLSETGKFGVFANRFFYSLLTCPSHEWRIDEKILYSFSLLLLNEVTRQAWFYFKSSNMPDMLRSGKGGMSAFGFDVGLYFPVKKTELDDNDCMCKLL